MLACARVLGLLSSAFVVIVSAQQVPIARVTRPVNESERVTLSQKPHRLARPEFDRGSAPATLPMDRMLLVLKRAPEQTAQLKTLLDSQLRKSSPQYRKWLTPEEFGAQFGPADQDLKTVAAWLQSHGFAVKPAAKGKGAIEFSGNAQQVNDAFHTAIHRFVVKGEEHWASISSPSIPAALAPVVAGITTLNSFHISHRSRHTLSARPLLTNSDGAHALSPEDYATIYNINPLYQAAPAIDGTGSTIAVVGQDFVDPSDLSDFRTTFKLKASQPQILYPYGQLDNTDSGIEGTLDASWSGATAPGAAINYVAIPDTFADEGLFLSELYIVDNNLGDIVTESFSVCEADSDPAFNTFIESVREQAAAQGMTYIVSAGDSGPYGCDDFDTELTVSDPTLVSVNLLAASPYVTAVGGTMFNDTTDPTKFWSAPERLPSQGTAKSYIPEIAWEESCDSEFCFMNILAGSGGQSSIYPKPSWQSGVTGIQQDGTRDLPDVALAASGVEPYLICLYEGCEDGELYGASGTSAAAPSFAGIMALVRQKVGSRLGAINPQLYALAAAQNYANCNASLDTVASTCIFNDITAGSSGVNGEPDFGTATALYQAAAGYDMATGLGSVNAANLVNSWSISGELPTITTLTISPTTLVHGATANMTIAVAPASGTGIPAGPVDLTTSTISFGSFPLTSGSAQSSTPPLAGGTYSVSAVYGGDGTYAASTSNAVPVTVTPEPSKLLAQADLPCDTLPLCPVSTADYGSTVTLSAQVTGVSLVGAPSGMVTFTDSASTASGSLLLNNNGSSGFTISTLAVGTHTINMTYPGDASFMPSTAAPLTLTIQPAATTVVLTPNSYCGLPNTPVQLTAFVGSLYSGVDEGTLTVAGTTPPVTAPAGFITNLTIPSLPLGLNTITVNYSGDANYLASTGTVSVNISSGTCFASMVNAADYQAGVAPQEIVSIFGQDLAAATASVSGSKLPQTLGGTSVTISDAAGNSATADLFFVSPTQINCAVPTGLTSGPFTAQVTTAQGTSQFPITISPVSPALFTADGSGYGLPSAEIIRVNPQGQQTTSVVTSTPIAFNGDNLFLVLYGTGSANVSPSDSVQVMFNGQITTPSYIGPQGQFEGLDQINVPLPYTLAGEGSVNIQVVIDGIPSNTVTVPFQ